ncbi:hypothetical protein ACI7YT_12620 [Microbacterium sp. M]|uniref:hypothetical protein n=1 Tax=Microbacterium sp. M TaxID=3377125 RepID=UPI003866C13A
MNKSRIWAGVTAALLATALVGCAQQYTPSGTGVNSIDTNLPDGRTVVCVVASGGGVDCDWDGAQ